MKLRSLLIPVFFISAMFAGITSDKSALPTFSALLRDADTIVVYEGLPHPIFERGALEEEKRTKKVFSVSEELFYEKPLVISDEDRAALDSIFRTTTVSVPFRGEKLCGGFHADYMIEWKRKDERVAVVLLCFGCHEILVIAGESSQRTDMSEAGFNTLHPLLRKYRQERPLFKNGVQLKAAKPEPMTLPIPKIEITL